MDEAEGGGCGCLREMSVVEKFFKKITSVAYVIQKKKITVFME